MNKDLINRIIHPKVLENFLKKFLKNFLKNLLM